VTSGTPGKKVKKALDFPPGVPDTKHMTTHTLPRTHATYVTLANGFLMELVDPIRGTYRRVDEDDQYDEGPTCSLCDAVGHGYPGGGPCPLEMRGQEDTWEEEARYGRGF
jgi:hypothetical protein